MLVWSMKKFSEEMQTKKFSIQEEGNAKTKLHISALRLRCYDCETIELHTIELWKIQFPSRAENYGLCFN